MSSQAAPAPERQPAPPKRIPPLSSAYRKAHKSYVLVSALLASWELIGITLNTKDKWGIELTSPKAVPLILFTLVFYSGYKVTVEWLQVDAERKKNRAARLDYLVAHVIAFTAIGISVVQYLARIRIVDVLNRFFQSDTGRIPILAFGGGFIFVNSILDKEPSHRLVLGLSNRVLGLLLSVLLLGSSALFSITLGIKHGSHLYVGVLIGAGAGAGAAGILQWLGQRLVRRSLKA